MMKFRFPHLAVTALAASGCVEQVTPTEPLIEQAVFNALGGLHVGETITLSGAAANQILIGGTSVPGRFLVVPFHASPVSSAEIVIEVSGEGIAPGGLSSARAPGGSGGLTIPPGAAAGWGMHEALHAQQLEMVEPLLRSASARFDRGFTVPNPRTDLGGTDPFVGQIVTINASAIGPACQAEDRRTGRVEAITQHAIVIGDVDNPSGGFTRADYEEFGRQFDELVLPTVTEYFPEPTDIDDNGKVVIFFTRAVNELTGPDDEGFVGGFFHARDLFPIGECAMSNEGELFFILAPDPNAEASHIPHSRERVFQQGVATIGHELQHLINAGRRIYVNTTATSFEETWLDEGLSHIVEELLFYEAANLGPERNLSLDDVRSTQNILVAINRFGVQNLARYGLYLEDVTRESPIGRDRLETRGAAWSFLRYSADHTELPQTQFFRRLGDSALTGFNNLNAVLEEDALEQMQDWGVSVYTDDVLEAGDSILQQPSWHFRSLLPALFQEFPLDVRDLAPGESETFRLPAAASGYLLVQGTAGETSRLVTTSANAAPTADLSVTVVRLE